MSFIKVNKIDKNGNIIETFDSVRDAVKDSGVCSNTFNKYVEKNKDINEYKYIKVNKKPHKIAVQCDNCGKSFMCENWRVKTREHLFCSKQCEGEYRKSQTKLNCICPICGTHFHVKPYRVKKSKNNYCSKECHRIAKMQYMKGENNHQYGLKGNLNASWKSDERISFYGYKLIRQLDHPFANCDGFVFEHRLIAEKYLLTDKNSIEINGNKYLNLEYDVHHKDFNRLNNNVSNLEILTRSEHMKLHAKFKKEKEQYSETKRTGGIGSTNE